MFKNTYSKFRLISFCEGLSFLILLFIAMPIKYIGENPYPVKIFGMAHGVLFILFCIYLYLFMREFNLSNKKMLLFFIYSFIPFGFIFIERDLKKLV